MPLLVVAMMKMPTRMRLCQTLLTPLAVLEEQATGERWYWWTK